MTRLSVVMSVFNGEEYLGKAIESILNQTYKDFEFIIINDGSSDSSLDIIHSYIALDPRIILISRENKGLIESLNEGINKSRGDFIARMDADDISAPTRFERQINQMLATHADICGCHYHVINNNGMKIETILVPLADESLFLSLGLSVPFAHGSVMFRNKFFSEHKLLYGQNAKFAEDKCLWVKMFELGAKFTNVDNVLFDYRELENSKSRLEARENKKDNNSIRDDFFSKNEIECQKNAKFLLENYNDLSVREAELFLDYCIITKSNIREVFRASSSRAIVISLVKALSRLI